MHRWLPPPLLVAIAALAMWAVSASLQTGRFAFGLQRALALTLLGLGLLLALAAIAALLRARTTVNPMSPARASQLVTGGVFALSRNPIYLADALILAALALWLGNVFNIALLALFVVFMDRVQIRAEERALSELFGQRYADYCARVRRWL